MLIKSGKKLGFFAALCMLVGSVVGIGIFFKNYSVLESNNWNAYGTLVAWIIGGLLSLSAAISFSEIGFIKTNKVKGLAAYSEIVVNKKFGYFIRFHYPFVLGLFIIVMSFFTTETIVSIFTTARGHKAFDVPIYGHVLIALGVLVFLQMINYLSLKTSGILQQITTILKWIPLVLVALLGIFLPDYSSENGGTNLFVSGGNFTFIGMLASLPAVLFAYDAFLNVTSMSNKVKGDNKKLPLIVTVGMVSIVILYTLIALSSILHGAGMVSGLPLGYESSFGLGIFDQIFSSQVAKVFGQIVIVFIAIAALGVTNGLCAVNQYVMVQCVKTDTYFGLKTLKKKTFANKLDLIYMYIIFTFWALIVFVPAIILNTDAYIDGISNFPSIFSFGMYAIIILFYTLKRDKFKNKKINDVLFKTFAWIAIVGIFLLIAYQGIYNFFIKTLIPVSFDSEGEIKLTGWEWKTNWGLFLNGNNLVGWQASIMFFSYCFIYFSFPFINRFFTKKFENNEVYIDTQKVLHNKKIKE